MALNLDITPKEKYLHISVTGVYELQPAKENLIQLLAACGQHKLSHVLVDFRSVEGSASKMDRYEFISSKPSCIHITSSCPENLCESRLSAPAPLFHRMVSVKKLPPSYRLR